MKKVAIVGVEGSGKTVLMAAMGDKYESPDANGVFLKPMNRETYSYYTKGMAKLRGGTWPLATESSVLELEWMLMRQSGSNAKQEQLGKLSFLDFGGEIYRLAFGDKGQAELDDLGLDEQRKNAIDRLKAHVENADALIVLVNLSDIINGNVDDADRKKAESTIEMNWLSQALLSFAYEKSTPKKNVALVFTQADTYSETIANCGGVRGTLAKYLRVIDSNYGNRLSLFEVAAVDKTTPARDGSGIPMPAPDFEPKGLEPLLGWIVKEIEPKRKRRTGLFATLLIGAASACIGYNASVDFKNWVDGQLTAIGWMQKETSVYANPSSAIPSSKPVEDAPKKPVKPAKLPKAEPKWIAGVSNPNNPNLVASESRDTWVATRPGYVWIKGTDRDEWKQGLRHPENSMLVSDWKEGEWKSAEEGYVWVGGSRIEWRAGKIFGNRKTGLEEDTWLHKCNKCGGSGNRLCTTCSYGNRKCPECGGKKTIVENIEEECRRCSGKGEIKCRRCNGRGRVIGMWGLEDCPNIDCRYGYMDCPNKLSIRDHCKNGYVSHVRRRDCDRCNGDGTINCNDCSGGYRKCKDCSGSGWTQE